MRRRTLAQVRQTLEIYKERGEFDGTLQSAKDCLVHAEYEWTPDVEAAAIEAISTVSQRERVAAELFRASTNLTFDVQREIPLMPSTLRVAADLLREDPARALEDLLEFVTSGRRYETRNPYTIPEVQAAFRALARKLPGEKT